MQFRFPSRVVCTAVLLFFLAFFFRFTRTTSPFWVDEFSSARQAGLYQRHGVGVFSLPEYIEHHNVTTYALIATSFSIFGKTEWSARLPFMVIGSFIPMLVYLLGRKIFSPTVGVIAGILTVCSYIEIVWSRQARGYVLQQALLLLLLYAVWMWIHSHKARLKSVWLGLAGVSAILGVLTHSMFLLPLGAVCVWLCAVYARDAKKLMTTPRTWIFGCAVLIGISLLGFWQRIQETIQIGLVGFSPHFGFYHAFLWREYGVVTILAILGIILGWGMYRRAYELCLAIVFSVLFFVTCIFQSLDTRYLLLFFPWIFFLWIGVTVEKIAHTISEYPLRRLCILIGIPLLLVANGHKFVLKPKPFYSVNHDFREIALLDYDQLYTYLRDHGGSDTDTAIIETWPDRLLWYFPDINDRGAVFRWKSGGVMRNTNTYRDSLGIEREVSSRLRFIGSKSDLDTLMKTYPKGFIWIDDTSLPRDVVDYVERTLHKEFTLDHYTLDDNPYSIWPGVLYSWGSENTSL